MAHPARRGRAQDLVERHPELGLRIAFDPRPSAPATALRAAREAWASCADDATHHLVLQDDAVLRDDFPDALPDLIRARSADALCLFAEWGGLAANAVRLAALLGHAWAEVVGEYVPSVGLILPAPVARGFGAYLDAAGTAGPESADDVALMGYLRSSGVSAYAPVGGPVEHGDAPSLVGNERQGRRQAVCDVPVDSSRKSTLTETGALSHLWWLQGTAFLYFADAQAPGGWRREPADQVLAAGGLPEGEVMAALRERLDASADPRALRDIVSDVLLREVWLSSVLLGCLAGEHNRSAPAPVPVDVALRDASVRRALATLAPGGLRRFVPDHRLDDLAALAEPVVRAGVEYGWGREAGVLEFATRAAAPER